MKNFKQLREDGAAAVAGPTNVLGSGNVAGIGQPPGSKSGEPGVDPMNKKKRLILGMAKRKVQG